MAVATAGLLAGVRVLDLTDGYAAFAARLLADLGGEVVRVEPADGGAARRRAPRAGDGTSLHHVHRNLGKTIVSGVDPGTLDGLLAGADIALCSESGVEPAASIAQRHGHLVVVSMTAFGLAGETATWRSTELVAQALAGVVYRSGSADLPPVAAPGSYCEDVGAVLGAVAALVALWQVRAGAPGQLVDLSTVLALAQCTDMSLPLWSQLRMDQVRAGAGLYPLFECTDGLARLVLPMSPGDWRSLISWLGSPPEWVGPAWEGAMLGPDERALIMARLHERFAAGSRADLAADGDAAGLRITPVLTPAEVLTNTHVQDRSTFLAVDLGDAGHGLVTAGLFGVEGTRSTSATAPTTAAAPRWSARPVATARTAPVSLPLQGLRVLEVGTGVAAPEAGRVLGEWGADVIKVETQGRPDFQRRVMGGDMNPAFATVNRNKRSFAVDLGTEGGRDLVHQLLPQVDVIIENNATGVIDRLGLGWDAVSAVNHRLVMVSTQLYGDRGPWARQKGYGPSARAIGGLTWLWAHDPGAPRGVMTIHPDHLAGRLVALGALAGLHARERTGRGSRLDLAQFEAVSTLIGDLLLAESLSPGAAQPVGNRCDEHAPWNVFRCADDAEGAQRWLAVCVPDDVSWSALASAGPTGLDREEWASEAGRLAGSARLEAELAAWLTGEEAAAVELRLQRAGVPAGQVLFPRAQAHHPHFVGRDYPVPLHQPGAGELIVEGPAFTAPGMGEPRCGPAPLPGEHTAEICRELLGLDDEEIALLVKAGTVDPLPAA